MSLTHIEDRALRFHIDRPVGKRAGVLPRRPTTTNAWVIEMLHSPEGGERLPPFHDNDNLRLDEATLRWFAALHTNPDPEATD